MTRVPDTSSDAAAEPSIVPFGDAALLVVFGEAIDVELNCRAHALAALVRRDRSTGAGWGLPIPGYSSLLVPYDPDRRSLEEARRELAALWSEAPRSGLKDADAPATIEIPTRYGGADGPDLESVASQVGLRPAQVIELHCSVTYRVFFLGFSPGFAYLGVLPPSMQVPRRATPRTRVPAGSVGIAGAQTGIYPRETPGGWQLIGRTEASLWDVGREPPALLAPGVRVRFRPV